MRTPRLTLTTMFLFSTAAIGCGAPAGEDNPSTVVATSDLQSDNGLNSINGLSATNGLNSINGLSATNGLSSTTGVSSTNCFLTTPCRRPPAS